MKLAVVLLAVNAVCCKANINLTCSFNAETTNMTQLIGSSGERSLTGPPGPPGPPGVKGDPGDTCQCGEDIIELKAQMAKMQSFQDKLKQDVEKKPEKLNSIINRISAPSDCSGITFPNSTSGYAIIQRKLPIIGFTTSKVYCDDGWTTIQKRVDGSVDFYRYYNEYENGFGFAETNYWIGLKWMHELTKNNDQQLRIVLEDKDT